jgi:carboxyl-terminal processing protease
MPPPTPFDHVEARAADNRLFIKIGDQTFVRDLPYDKRKLARILLEGVSFYRTALHLPQTVDELEQKALDAMLFRLDPHSGFLDLADYKNLQQDTQGAFGGVGVEIGLQQGLLTIVAPIAGSPAERAGLQSKDRILAIDRQDSLGQNLEWAVRRIRGKIGEPVTLTIKRPGREDAFDVTLVRDKIEAVAVKSRRLPNGVGYVRITQFNARTDEDLNKALGEMAQAEGGLRAIALDLRNDPGGLLEQAVAIANDFLPSGMIVNSIGRGYLPERERFADGRGRWTKTPLVVLVNAGSASASEIVAGALKDHGRALLVGYQTFGKGSVQSIFELRNETGLRLTTAMYYTPSGASIQEFGITPNIRFLPPDGVDDLSYSEARLEGHFKNRTRSEPPKPDGQLDAKTLYEAYLAKGWVKKPTDEPSDDADLLLVFTERLLAGDDSSVPALIARAKDLAVQVGAAR